MGYLWWNFSEEVKYLPQASRCGFDQKVGKKNLLWISNSRINWLAWNNSLMMTVSSRKKNKIHWALLWEGTMSQEHRHYILEETASCFSRTSTVIPVHVPL